MADYEWAMFMLKATWLAFVFALGACIGSLINVIVYRMPRGLGIVTPPSRCPHCNTRLGWRDNIPIVGWLALRGRCRYCRAPISPEYPLVETFVACLFALFYVLWFMVPNDAAWLGVHWGAIKPEWALNDPAVVWPSFLVLLALLGSLVAMTLVDAKTFTIPLKLAWFPAALAVIVHPAHAAWFQHFGGSTRPGGGLPYTAPGEVWVLATPGPHGWPWIGAAIGGVLGLGLAVLMLHFGLIRRSFADYDEWERSVRAERQGAAGTDEPPLPPDAAAPPAASSAQPAPEQISEPLPGRDHDNPATVSDAGSEGVRFAAVAPLGPAEPERPSDNGSPADLWIQYPHARREMIKEVLFLAPCLGLATAGWHAARWFAGPWTLDPFTGAQLPATDVPLWLTVLGGVLLGYLVGGGVVWMVRILGSLAFGKEAMGLGDVHLMAAVGACLGWIDATLAFFGAAFVGVFYTALTLIATRGLRRAMPYGPFLAVSTVLVLLGKPLVEHLLTVLTGATSPINIP